MIQMVNPADFSLIAFPLSSEKSPYSIDVPIDVYG